MNNLSLRRWTGVLLVLAPLAFVASFTLLQIQFEYPAILRQSTADVLRKFQAGGSALVATWYLITLSAVLFVPVAVLLHRVLVEDAPQEARPALWVASTFGVLAGLVQALGFIRWPVVVPYLAGAYLSPASSEAERQAIALIFQAVHLYAGAGVGETLGYLCTGTWTFLIGLTLLRSTILKPWMGLSGMVLAVGVALGTLEIAGWPAAAAINAISYLVWALWLMLLGLTLLWRRSG